MLIDALRFCSTAGPLLISVQLMAGGCTGAVARFWIENERLFVNTLMQRTIAIQQQQQQRRLQCLSLMHRPTLNDARAARTCQTVNKSEVN